MKGYWLEETNEVAMIEKKKKRVEWPFSERYSTFFSALPWRSLSFLVGFCWYLKRGPYINREGASDDLRSFTYPAFGKFGGFLSFWVGNRLQRLFFGIGFLMCFIQTMVRQFFEVKRIICFDWVVINNHHFWVVLEDVDFLFSWWCFMDSIPSNSSPVFLNHPFGRRFLLVHFFLLHSWPVAANPSWESTHVRLTTTWVSSLKSRRIWKRRWKDFKGKMGGFGEWRRKKNAVEGECSWIWLFLLFCCHICCWLWR